MRAAGVTCKVTVCRSVCGLVRQERASERFGEQGGTGRVCCLCIDLTRATSRWSSFSPRNEIFRVALSAKGGPRSLRPRSSRRQSEGLLGLPESYRASEQLGLQKATQWTIMSKKDEGDDLEAKREREVCCSAPSACCCAVCCAVCCDGRCRTSAPGPFNPPAKGFIVRICAGRLRSGRSRSSSRSWRMHAGALPQLAAVRFDSSSLRVPARRCGALLAAQCAERSN